MACRGVHFAIESKEAERLLAATSDDAVLEIIEEEIEEAWDEEWLVETDTAWDAIHRCLTDGLLDIEPKFGPRGLAILGGRQLHQGEEYIIALVTPEEAGQVASSLAEIDPAWFRQRYDAIDPDDYGGPKSNEDFDYTWEYFKPLAAFFKRAGEAGRFVIFTVDQ